jgi:hypothetical protein
VFCTIYKVLFSNVILVFVLFHVFLIIQEKRTPQLKMN